MQPAAARNGGNESAGGGGTGLFGMAAIAIIIRVMQVYGTVRSKFGRD